MRYINRPIILLLMTGMLSIAACSREADTVSASRFVEPDRLYQTLVRNVQNQPGFEIIADIDHARLAARTGSPMPPSHVLIWSDPALDAAILRHNPLAAIDLPLRVLAYEDVHTHKAMVIANSYTYLASRYSLPDDESIRERYTSAIASAMKGISRDEIASFPSDTMKQDGLVTLDSSHDFAATEQRILDAINAQDDTVIFGIVDFTSRAGTHGIDLPPMRLILFGAPGPGGKAMKSAPTLGLDAFCQKLLIWQDADGNVQVSFNDLLTLAGRHQVTAGVALRGINARLKRTFSKALKK